MLRTRRAPVVRRVPIVIRMAGRLQLASTVLRRILVLSSCRLVCKASQGAPWPNRWNSPFGAGAYYAAARCASLLPYEARLSIVSTQSQH